MHPLTRAALASILVFWALCSLFFVQPFTGSFLLVAAPAALIAVLVFLAVRSRRRSPSGAGRSEAPGVAAILGVVLLLLGAMFAVGRWPMLWDPCHTWSDDSTSGSISPDDPCSSMSSTSQSRAAFLLQSLAGEVTLMVGGALAVWSARRQARLARACVGAAMLLPTAILFRGMSMAFILVFLLGIGLVLCALLMPASRRLEAPPPSA